MDSSLTNLRKVDHDLVRRLRVEKMMTQHELATAAGIGLDTLGQMERGERDSTLRTIRRVADVLGVDPK